MSYSGPTLKLLSSTPIERTCASGLSIQTAILFANQPNSVETYGDGQVHVYFPSKSEHENMSQLFPEWKTRQSYFFVYNTWNRFLFLASFDKKGDDSPLYSTYPSWIELEEKQTNTDLQQYENEINDSYYLMTKKTPKLTEEKNLYIDGFATLSEHGRNIYNRFGIPLIFDGNRAFVSRGIYSEDLNLREYLKTLVSDSAKRPFQQVDRLSHDKSWLHVHYMKSDTLNQEEIPEEFLAPVETKYKKTKKLGWQDYATLAEKLKGVQSEFFSAKETAAVSFPIRPLIDHQLLLKLMGSLSPQRLESGLRGKLYFSDLSQAQLDNAVNCIWKEIQLHQVHVKLVNDLFDAKSNHKKLWINFAIVPLEQVGSSNGELIQIKFGIDETEGLLTAFRITYMQDNP